MQTIDIIIVIVLLLPALAGIIYGFLNIAFSLCAWALAFCIAAVFSARFAPMLESFIDTPALRLLLVFVGLFMVSLIILTILSTFAIKLLSKVGLTPVDRLLGVFLGLGLGVLIVQLIIFLSGFTALPQEAWWGRSKIIKPFETVSIWSRRYLPEQLLEHHSYPRQAKISVVRDG